MTSHKPRNLIKESWSSLCMTGIVGLRLIELCKTKLFGYIYVIGILILYYTLIYFTKEEADKVYEYLDITTICVAKIRRIEYYVNAVVLGLMLITSGFKFNLGTTGVYSNLNEIDNKLKLLNQKLNYDKYMRDNILNITGVVISTILIGLTDYSSTKNAASNITMFNLMWFGNQFPQIVNSIATATFVTIIASCCTRQQIINDLIFKLRNIDKESYNTDVISQEMHNGLKLKLLRKIFEILSNTVIIINEAYGFMLILTFITHFIGISAHLYIVYMTFGEQNYIVDLIVEFLWACFYFGKLIYIISACHSFEREGKRASKLLHECRIDSDYNLLKQETESFARQVRNVDIKITASNLFTVDYPALWKIVLGQTAYVFFLSQFTSTK
ncbi:gustatory receptor for sugar taste 43a-like isoform X1 [Cotesia glomerata]|uniref:Gustatory receptor n=1 Tax=Cotesia glomerata TaxID=32391 RepID=A0AAV7I883_COTGL|nr:gustatory receptor for sugar taste 43a-like isoform X1 [Cotesia glomerata]KAH0545613.1 hypothetical protein KQX54_001682 [Cotesia glomerata]